MANNFPSALNNFLTGSNSQPLNTVGHAEEHNALEAKIGIDNSAVTTSLDYLLKNPASKNPGHYHTNGGPTILVAALNAPTFIKNKADYVCTGANDQNTINTAIAALPATGGVIQLSQNDFVLSGTVNKPSDVIIRGMGRRTTRLYKASSGFYAVSVLGTSSANVDKGGLECLTIEGNGQTGGGLLVQFAQTQFFNDISVDGNNDVAIDIITSQDSYFHQVTCNTNHSTTRPVISIAGGVGGVQNSNMIWFSQCRIEDFWNGAVNIQQGSGYSGNNNGFYFHQCKFESTQVGGNMFTADFATLDLHLKNCFFSATGFKSGFSTPVDAINTQAHNLASYEGIFFNASNGIGNTAINITSLNGQTTINNVLFNGTPVTGVVNFGSSGATFDINGLATGGGSLITGDPSGINTIQSVTKFTQNVRKPIVTKTANYTITNSDYAVIASGVGTTITLPDATARTGAVFVIKRRDASNTITVATTSSQTIDGSTTFSLSADKNSIIVQSDGSNWQIIGNV